MTAREVPGPPRGRRRAATGPLRQRVEAARAFEEAAGPVATWRAMLRLARDVILLVKDLASDPRISRGRRWTPAALVVAYLVSPVHVVPRRTPVLGRVDELIVGAWALRRLLASAGYDVIYDLWRGTDEGLALILTLAGVQE
jgi:uncharacterized membrane protein YkvA (DUF1232 family)